MTQAAPEIDPAPDGRQQLRTHLFVAATLYADRVSTPVTIRNMSQTGALIEAPALPDVGERVKLKRGHLHANGWIAWRVERKAGVRLDASIHVSDWMSRQVSAGQERVDELVSMVKGDSAVAPAICTNLNSRLSVEGELCQLRLELAALEKALLNDVIVVATHPEIQTIDISIQRIDRILKGLGRGG